MKFFDSWFKPVHFELHSKNFFVRACLTAALFFVVSCWFVPVAWGIAYVVCAMLITGMVLDVLARKENLTIRQYNHRYEITIYLGVIVTTTSMYLIDDTYVLLVPLVLGLLYNSANVYIRSKRLNYVIPLFMLEPFIKVFSFDSSHPTLEYSAVLLLCLAVGAISDGLFRSAAVAKDESEHKRALMQTVFRSMHSLQVHDIRNLACKLQVLSLPEYRDSVKLAAKLEELVNELDTIADMKLFSTPTEVDLRELVNSMAFMRNKHVCLVQGFSDNDVIVANKHILYTTIKNVFENSIEAALRKRMNPKIVFMHDTAACTITITDNCGGFDVARIRTGVSSKPGQGHGTFLSTITDQAIGSMFGLKVNVTRVPDGTCVTINYNQPLESIH